MAGYKMRIHVEMIPCDEAPTREPVTAQDGSVSLVLSETDAMNIDACEHALLQTTYPTLRETLAPHLSEVSKKSPGTPAGGHVEPEYVALSRGWRAWPIRVSHVSGVSAGHHPV